MPTEGVHGGWGAAGSQEATLPWLRTLQQPNTEVENIRSTAEKYLAILKLSGALQQARKKSQGYSL